MARLAHGAAGAFDWSADWEIGRCVLFGRPGYQGHAGAEVWTRVVVGGAYLHVGWTRGCASETGRQ